MATSSVPRSDAELAPRPPVRAGLRGLLAIAALLLVTALAAQTCQQSQVRVSKEAAITTAQPRAGFTPDRTQVRLVRQGLNSRPFWAISFSAGARVTTVRVDANTGAVAAVNKER